MQVADCGFRLFTEAIAGGGVVKAIAVPNGSRITNSALKAKGDVFEQAMGVGGAGLLFARVKIASGELPSLEAPKAVKEALAGREQALVRPLLHNRSLPQTARPVLTCVAAGGRVRCVRRRPAALCRRHFRHCEQDAGQSAAVRGGAAGRDPVREAQCAVGDRLPHVRLERSRAAPGGELLGAVRLSHAHKH